VRSLGSENQKSRPVYFPASTRLARLYFRFIRFYSGFDVQLAPGLAARSRESSSMRQQRGSPDGNSIRYV
jgi:hypothetical protein